MRTIDLICLLWGCVILATWGCSTANSDTENTDSSSTDSTPSDADSDADADGDADTDTDADTDSDAPGTSDDGPPSSDDSDFGGSTDSESEEPAIADTATVGTDTNSDTDSEGDIDNDSDSNFETDTPEDSATLGDSETTSDIETEDSETVVIPGKGALSGVVMAPSGDLPISGALVYLSHTMPTPIPDHAYDYQCDDMSGKFYTLSGPDGSWQLENVPAGSWLLVTRKGHFRRIREIEVTADTLTELPQEITTLPAAKTDDGMDFIPNFAVLLADPDKIFNLLAKFGMGETDAVGDLQFGTETFALFSDRINQPGYPESSSLFADLDTLLHYHMIFLPCYSAINGADFVRDHAQMLRDYVSAGGKIYNSCTVSLWTESAFPEYIDFYPDTSSDAFDVGRVSNTAYETNGQILDDGLSAWLNVVTTEDVSNYPFVNGYVKIDGVNDVDDGHGLTDDDGVVKPYTWVEDIHTYAGSPLIVTYNFDAGKVFYSVYETSLQVAQKELTPQEYVLLYVILEVGVCTGVIVV